MKIDDDRVLRPPKFLKFPLGIVSIARTKQRPDFLSSSIYFTHWQHCQSRIKMCVCVLTSAILTSRLNLKHGIHAQVHYEVILFHIEGQKHSTDWKSNARTNI